MNVFDSISDKKLNFEKLITEILPFEDYNKIYDDINKSNSIASILEYSSNIGGKENRFKSFSKEQSNCVLGIIGAGAFTKSTLLPALNKTKASLNISSFNV